MITGTFWTNDGELVFIQNSDDLVNLVKERIGFEAGRMVQGLAEKATREAAIADTDIRSYESELSELHQLIDELQQIARFLLPLSNKKTINSADKWELRRLAEKIRNLA